MWTKKDRVLAAFNHEIPDHLPMFDYIINDKVLEHFRGGEHVPIGDRCAVIEACTNYIDLCHPMDAPAMPHEIQTQEGTRIIYERWGKWTVYDRTQEEFIEVVKREIEQWEACKVTDQDIKEYRQNAEKNITAAGDTPYVNLDFVFRIFPGSIEEGIYLYYDEPELAERWNQAYNTAQLLKLQAFADSKYSLFVFESLDLAMKDGLLYSQDLMDKLLFPYIEQATNIIHSRGMKYIKHTDGYIMPIMDRLVACGIDAVHPIELSAGMSLAEVKNRYGREMTLIGGMDGVYALANGTVDDVVRAAKELIRVGAPGGGFFAASSTGEQDNSMPYENLMAYYDTIWKYGVY